MCSHCGAVQKCCVAPGPGTGQRTLGSNVAAECGCGCFQVPEGRRGYETWRYKGGYWEARETGNWAGIRDIYGDGPPGFKAPELLY